MTYSDQRVKQQLSQHHVVDGDRIVRFAPRQKLPPFYCIKQMDSEHFYWQHASGSVSDITVDKWSVYRGCWNDYKRLLREQRK